MDPLYWLSENGTGNGKRTAGGPVSGKKHNCGYCVCEKFLAAEIVGIQTENTAFGRSSTPQTGDGSARPAVAASRQRVLGACGDIAREPLNQPHLCQPDQLGVVPFVLITHLFKNAVTCMFPTSRCDSVRRFLIRAYLVGYPARAVTWPVAGTDTYSRR
jgi:hypothetical protein